MKCIYCSADTKVTNSRLQKRKNNTWRRRQCTSCESVFTSIESPDLESSIMVLHQIDDKEALEPFSRDKLLLSIHDSLRHRKTALDDATALTDTIISQALPLVSEALINASQLAKISHKILKRFDHVAATHYLAFHPA